MPGRRYAACRNVARPGSGLVAVTAGLVLPSVGVGSDSLTAPSP